MYTELDSAICVGILAYAADDVSLLSPIATFYGMQKMLTVCSLFAKESGLLFNIKKRVFSVCQE